ncbi:MAG: hypothetical protein KatS3mg061_3244 [Dehalococcoidia bacterium]|nr:MAG: hypothetical protein KatS3mg061_3244 [Dehalococcoidia bacterium]
MALVTMTMWTIASLGIAAEMLFLVLPWSLGLFGGVDPLLARTLFWFTGHPIVYFWLLPAYLSWYTMVPQQAGGRLFSDPMARRLLSALSAALDPGRDPPPVRRPRDPPGDEAAPGHFHLRGLLPQPTDVFNVVASLELAGRARGGRGWLGWIPRLPWNDPS